MHYPKICELEARHGVQVSTSYHTRMDYLMVSRPQSATANGLFQVLEGGLQSLGIKQVSAEECKKLVGVGTDGAASNIAASGLKGLVERCLGWVFWMIGLGFLDVVPCTLTRVSCQGCPQRYLL